MLSKLLCAFTLLYLSGCACFSHRNAKLSDFSFSVLHPHAVTIYKPLGGAPPANDRIFIYLSLQNDDTKDRPLCFCGREGEEFKTSFFSSGHKLKPVVEVDPGTAPILEAKARVIGIAGKDVDPAERFPTVLPDDTDFPLNEANYRRDFVVMVRPDRSKVGQEGSIKVRVTLANVDHPDDKSSPIATFEIPIKIVDEFRPEAMTRSIAGGATR